MNEQQKSEIIELYKVMSADDIAIKYGVTGQCIRWNLKNSGVKLLPKGTQLRLPIDDIKEMYSSGLNCREISEKYGCSPIAISRSLKRIGFTVRDSSYCHRTTTLNEDCFSEINEQSAYWAGFLMADGTIFDRGNERFSITLGLSSTDSDHIGKFRDFLGSSRKINNRTFLNEIGNTQHVTSISVSSNIIAKDLAEMGVVPGKTGREVVSNALKYNRHFWRGMIDGDGCIRLSKSRSIVALQFCGSETIVQQFCDFVKSIFPKSYMKPLKVKTANCYRCSTCYKRAIGIIRVLYSDCSVYLDRKKEIVDKILTLELPPDHTRKWVSSYQSIQLHQ